jgi:1-acyl-sn-glycerol-3-phosphate acyltransferase
MVAPWVSEHPGLKHLISRLGHVAVHRGDPEAAAAQERELEARLQRGETLAVFPEGGFEITPGLRPFALGAFQLAARAGVPVIPLALKGLAKLSRPIGLFPIVSLYWRWWESRWRLRVQIGSRSFGCAIGPESGSPSIVETLSLIAVCGGMTRPLALFGERESIARID